MNCGVYFYTVKSEERLWALGRVSFPQLVNVPSTYWPTSGALPGDVCLPDALGPSNVLQPSGDTGHGGRGGLPMHRCPLHRCGGTKAESGRGDPRRMEATLGLRMSRACLFPTSPERMLTQTQVPPRQPRPALLCRPLLTPPGYRPSFGVPRLLPCTQAREHPQIHITR